MVFHPTFLYVKMHTVTGKMYLGKTTRPDPVKYKGSGVAWKAHLRKYGSDKIITLWYKLFTDREQLVSSAVLISSCFDVVESTSWLNLIPEDGLGTPKGIVFSEAHRKNIAIAKNGKHCGSQNPFYGKSHTAASIEKMRLAQTGDKHSQFGKTPTNEHRRRIGIANSGKKRTIEMNILNSQRNRGIVSAFDLEEKKVVRIDRDEFIKMKNVKYVGMTSKRAAQ